MNKKILLAIMAIIVVITIGVSAFTLGVFGQTTEVNTKFLSGTIQGEAVENNTNITLPGWELNYDDTENGIKYEFFMADSLNFTKNIFIHAGGAKKIDIKEYNGFKWEIYYLDGDLAKKNNFSDDGMSGFLCFASGKNGDYGVLISSVDVSSDNALNSELFKGYVEPLLMSIILKDPQNPPKEYQAINSTKEEFDLTKKYIKENGWDTLINNI